MQTGHVIHLVGWYQFVGYVEVSVTCHNDVIYLIYAVVSLNFKLISRLLRSSLHVCNINK